MIGRVSGFITCGLLVLGIAVGSSVIVAAQDSTLPKDPAVAYIERVMLPVMRGEASVYGDAQTFYDQWLSQQSRAQVTKFQFVSYVQTEANKVSEKKTFTLTTVLHYQIST